ncbi:MAG: hypothetical protein JXB39_04045 [Deltaproteobacteria bacterium]|nr:hypothetical protein [Deltaproteobacteria bacterium]
MPPPSSPGPSKRGRALRVASAIALACLVLPGGLRPAEIALGVGLLAVSGLGGNPRASRGVEIAAIGVLTLLFVASVLPVLDLDRPTGTDWMSYLKNAVAVATDDWSHYKRWRGPGYAWASLAAARVTGGLVAGSILVSLVSATALVPLTALFGRRIAGPEAGVLAAALVVGWADLRLHAIASTPYALFAALLLLGTVAALGPAEVAGNDGTALPGGSEGPPVGRRTAWARAVLAGTAFGCAYATDPRASAIAGLVLLGEAGAAILTGAKARRSSAGVGRRAWVRLATTALAALVALVVGAGSLAALPVDLLPLKEQIALQRDLHARETAHGCGPKGPELPTLADFVGPCGRSTLRGNLVRGQRATPVDPAFIAGLVALGLVVVRRGRMAVLAPLLPLAPALFILGVQNRYFLPAAPGMAVAGGAALAWLAGAPRREPTVTPIALPWTPRGVATTVALLCVVAASAWGWARSPGTLWSEVHRGTTLGFSLQSGAYSEAASAIRRGVRPRDRVVDCTRAGLPERLWPHPVLDWSPKGGAHVSQACHRLIAQEPRTPTWILLRVHPEVRASAGWEVVLRHPESGGALVLLKGG